MLSDQEIPLIRQLLALRKRKEERVQSHLNELRRQQVQCRQEKQRAYEYWLESRTRLEETTLPSETLDRACLNRLLAAKHQMYVDERAKAALVDEWQSRIENLAQAQHELREEQASLIRGQEKLKEVLNDN
tara:strand:+ start:57 stop:449 length:393 start_codon:yes stop_codon:yes gene_type:complete